MANTTPTWTRGGVLGRGSTATVSLAYSPHQPLFAVKSAEFAASGFLRREQAILSHLNSPYIISYLGSDVTQESSTTHYNLHLEYAPGGSIHDEIKKLGGGGGGLPEPSIRARARDILLGLSYLHSLSIAHCDVKNHNVLISADGRAKLADLGCARFVNGASADRPQFMGTPMFMAPEVARGEDQGTAADVWAVGCAVIEMASGRPPWPNATDAAALLHQIAFSGEAPEAPAWLSEEGKDFASKCLKRKAEERSTVDELLKHRFVTSSTILEGKRTSPKSTLDLSFWDSLSEGEEEEFKTEHPGARTGGNAILDLCSSSGAGSPNWSWDESWMTVRDGEAAAATATSNRESVEIPAADEYGVTGEETGQDEGGIIHDTTLGTTTDHIISMYDPNECSSERNAGGGESSRFTTLLDDDCSSSVTEILLANWISALVPVVKKKKKKP